MIIYQYYMDFFNEAINEFLKSFFKIQQGITEAYNGYFERLKEYSEF